MCCLVSTFCEFSNFLTAVNCAGESSLPILFFHHLWTTLHLSYYTFKIPTAYLRQSTDCLRDISNVACSKENESFLPATLFCPWILPSLASCIPHLVIQAKTLWILLNILYLISHNQSIIKFSWFYSQDKIQIWLLLPKLSAGTLLPIISSSLTHTKAAHPKGSHDWPWWHPYLLLL